MSQISLCEYLLINCRHFYNGLISKRKCLQYWWVMCNRWRRISAAGCYSVQTHLMLSTLWWISVKTLRPRQDGRLFPDDIFESIFLNESVQILIEISLTCVPKAPINNIRALVQIMAWHHPGNKPLSEPILILNIFHMNTCSSPTLSVFDHKSRILIKS